MRAFLAVAWSILSLVPASSADLRSFAGWTEYGGGPDSSQYSSLKQINKANVSRLEVAWMYPTGERGNYTFNRS